MTMTHPGPLPREHGAAAVSWLALRFEGLLGFIVYGLLWTFVASFAAVLSFMGALLGVTARGAASLAWLPYVVLGGTFLLFWVAFVEWVRRRTRPAVRLFREGTRYEGVVVGVKTERVGRSGRGRRTDAEIAFRRDDGTAMQAKVSFFHGPSLSSGLALSARAPVFYLGGERRCASFTPAGAMMTGVVEDA